jgi:ADP-ribosylglycohydrolase
MNDLKQSKSANHQQRMAQAQLSLEGLSIGDGFGQRFGRAASLFRKHFENRDMPNPPWLWTDDTAMAIEIVLELAELGRIDQDSLAKRFAKRFVDEPERGYGAGAKGILTDIRNGMPWRDASYAAFGGTGSMGNGGAMRVAPIGAYFGDDLDAAKQAAMDSAEVTHAHADGQAGAVAVAIAAAMAVNPKPGPDVFDQMFSAVLDYTPDSMTRNNIIKARALGPGAKVQAIVQAVGNGSHVISNDTVPFVIWSAATHFHDFDEAMWGTASGLGDVDTTCAMVGGIVAGAVDFERIKHWAQYREALPDGLGVNHDRL